MSKQEFNRLDVLLRVLSGRLRVEDACGLLGLRRRQVFRDGATSLLSKRRGKPSNHRLPAEVRNLALSIVRELGAALAMVKEHQASFAPNQRRYDPARGRPPNNLEARGMPTKNRSRRDGLPRIFPEIDGRPAAR